MATGRDHETPQTPLSSRIESGCPLRDFMNAHRQLEKHDFLARHPYPFLIQINAEQSDGSEYLGFSTEQDNAEMRPNLLLENLESRVFYLVKRNVNHFSHMITVGRARNNDLVFKTSKVSKFHAFFEQLDGQWLIQDSNSSNGTYLLVERLSPQQTYPIRDGDLISFGRSLNFAFVLSETMYHRCRQL